MSSSALEAGRQAPPVGPLRAIFRAHRGRILFTYALFALENLVGLAGPLALGLAINGLLQRSWAGLVLFASQHALWVALATFRRAYDTRTFTAVYGELAARLVLLQRQEAVAVSQVAARSALSREIVDFFERDLPFVLHTLCGVAGAVLMLALIEWRVVPLCLALLVPLALFSLVYGRKTLALNRGLHDQLEAEVNVIEQGGPAAVREHYAALARWRVWLSDWDAIGFAGMQSLLLALLAAALVLGCGDGGSAGHVATVVGYVQVFALGLLNVPALVEQLGRLRDVARRVSS